VSDKNQKFEYLAGRKHRGPCGIQLDESDVDEIIPREETPQEGAENFIDSVKKDAKKGDRFAKFFVKCLARKK
jgi:hypothetical protein